MSDPDPATQPSADPPATGQNTRPDPIRYVDESRTGEVSHGYGTSTGWAGAGTSQARATAQVSTGKTAVIQRFVIARLEEAGRHGATVNEIRSHHDNDLHGFHHGSVSSALSNLHRDGRIARLAEVRDGAKVYVLNGAVAGRPTEEQGHRGKRGTRARIRRDRFQLEFGAPCDCGAYVLPAERGVHRCDHQEVGETFRPSA